MHWTQEATEQDPDQARPSPADGLGVLRGQWPRGPRPAHDARRGPAPRRPTSWSTELPEHEGLVRTLLGLPAPTVHVRAAPSRRAGPARVRRRRLRRGRPAADPRLPRQGRRQAGQARQARRTPDERRPVPLRLRPRGGAGLRQGRRRLRDRPRRLLGDRGPGVRRHPADHQEPPRGRRGHLRRARGLDAGTPTTAPWCSCPRWARSPRSPTRSSPPADPRRPRSR